MAAGGGTIAVTMTRLDGEKQKFPLKLAKQTTVKALKARVEMEQGIPPCEQLLMFRGMILERDTMQPLATPDLQEIIAEAGPEGLQMAVFRRPLQLDGFIKSEQLVDGKVVDENSKRRSGGTVLHRAIRQSNFRVIEELLDREEFSGVNARDNAGQTGLHTAVETWNREASELVLRCKRFVASGVADKQGRTALHLAAHWGDLPTVRRILEHPKFTAEDVQAVDVNGRTAAEYAEQCGHKDVAEAIANNKCPPRKEEREESSVAEDASIAKDAGGDAEGDDDEVEARDADSVNRSGEDVGAEGDGNVGAGPASPMEAQGGGDGGGNGASHADEHAPT